MNDRSKFLVLAVCIIAALIVMKVSVCTGVFMLIVLALVIGAMASKH